MSMQKLSNLFGKTRREVSKDVELSSQKYLVQAGFIDMLSAGVYSFLPLGWRVHKKIENIIREEMDAIGGQEIFMPALQPATLWKETGRWSEMAEEMFQFKDHSGKDLALGMTHEEVITDLLRKNINSYRDLPFMAYQIQTKFRDEKRPRGGLLRTREFIMKDAYSFHADEKTFNDHYKQEIEAYKKIFKRCGLDVLVVRASSGAMGGKNSQEFVLPSEVGEDNVLACGCNYAANVEALENKTCPECKKEMKEVKGIELGHVFQLGTKYSEEMKANFIDKDGKEKPIIMGCYGIGLGRLMAAAVEAHHDDKGIIWPREIAPYDAHLVILGTSKEVLASAEKAKEELEKIGMDVLVDDRKESTGIKLNDADLLGIPLRIIVSEKTVKDNVYEVKSRSEKEAKLVKSLAEIK